MTFMSNLGKVSSPTCKVLFAGFESDTYRLQQAGWQFSFERMINSAGIRLAMKYEPARIYAITAPIADRALYEFAAKQPSWEFPIPFQVIMVGNDIRCQIIPMMGAGQWGAFDATPQYHQTQEVKFEDLVPFRPISTDAKEIVIAQDNVPAMLEAILKLQDPKQAEIRERQRKEAWLVDAGLKEGYAPQRDIRAQIITLAG